MRRFKRIQEGYDSENFKISPTKFDRDSLADVVHNAMIHTLGGLRSDGLELEDAMDEGVLNEPIKIDFDISFDGWITYDPITGKGEIFYRN